MPQSDLLPNLDTPVIVNGRLARLDEQGQAAAFPRTNGAGSVLIGGTYANGDTFTLTFASTMFSASIAVPITSIAGDSNATVAQRLAAAIQANATLQALGVQAVLDPVISAKILLTLPGPLGKFITVSGASSGAETFTVVQFAGGSGPVIPLINFQIVNNGGIVRFRIGRRILLDPITLATLAAGGVSPKTGLFPCQ